MSHLDYFNNHSTYLPASIVGLPQSILHEAALMILWKCKPNHVLLCLKLSSAFYLIQKNFIAFTTAYKRLGSSSMSLISSFVFILFSRCLNLNGFHAVLQMHWEHSCLRALACAAPTAWKTVPSSIHMIHSLSLNSLLKCQLNKEVFPEHLSKSPLPPSFPTYSFCLSLSVFLHRSRKFA